MYAAPVVRHFSPRALDSAGSLQTDPLSSGSTLVAAGEDSWGAPSSGDRWRAASVDTASTDAVPGPGPAAVADVAADVGGLGWRVRGMVRTLRPHQWVKNLFVIAPVVFAGDTRPITIFTAIAAFFVFCLVAGAVYTLNDIVDRDADRVHPVKRFRPIASGQVSIGLARSMIVALLVVALGGALAVRPLFFAVAVTYFALNVAYSLVLKKKAYVDVSCIAIFFVLRVLGGGLATQTPLSGPMLWCTATLALFLGFGKRRHELASANAAKQRSALEAYSPQVLTFALALTGLASIAGYVWYALDPKVQHQFSSKWLWLTAVHPLYGVLRFLQLVVGRPKAESPTQEMLRDLPFMLNLGIWMLEAIVIIYKVHF